MAPVAAVTVGAFHAPCVPDVGRKPLGFSMRCTNVFRVGGGRPNPCEEAPTLNTKGRARLSSVTLTSDSNRADFDPETDCHSPLPLRSCTLVCAECRRTKRLIQPQRTSLFGIPAGRSVSVTSGVMDSYSSLDLCHTCGLFLCCAIRVAAVTLIIIQNWSNILSQVDFRNPFSKK